MKRRRPKPHQVRQQGRPWAQTETDREIDHAAQLLATFPGWDLTLATRTLALALTLRGDRGFTEEVAKVLTAAGKGKITPGMAPPWEYADRAHSIARGILLIQELTGKTLEEAESLMEMRLRQGGLDVRLRVVE